MKAGLLIRKAGNGNSTIGTRHSTPVPRLYFQVNAYALQFDIIWEDKPANFEKVRRLLTKAPPERNSLVVLPEMFATGFSMNVDAIAEPYGGETERFLA